MGSPIKGYLPQQIAKNLTDSGYQVQQRGRFRSSMLIKKGPVDGESKEVTPAALRQLGSSGRALAKEVLISYLQGRVSELTGLIKDIEKQIEPLQNRLEYKIYEANKKVEKLKQKRTEIEKEIHNERDFTDLTKPIAAKSKLIELNRQLINVNREIKNEREKTKETIAQAKTEFLEKAQASLKLLDGLDPVLDGLDPVVDDQNPDEAKKEKPPPGLRETLFELEQLLETLQNTPFPQLLRENKR